ncbi:PREDICTED: probable E3 ubiquitin-protein ligase rbrA [Camelina sativa]|uniref:RBR-type E3 ubiquitin transferase n=1 Tax=Camelina sativa TaxID=90675 RepID=A0ABM0SVW4_CAMSA|nr:PREDICTED: probable E3 ubiquitin-protein ligase rbrA [Camelina sativa]
MERCDLDSSISKKRRIDSTITEDLSNLKGEGSSKVGESICTKNKFADSTVYRLYFKGLVSDKTTTDNEKMVFAGIGVAICDDADSLLYEMKESVDATKILSRVEILGAICGINHSIQLGIKKLVIYCDDYRIYQLINGRGDFSTQTLEDLVGEFIHYKEKLASSEIVLVAPNDVKFAYKLARDVIASQISSNPNVEAAQGVVTCLICYDDADDHMLFTNNCGHRHCFTCVKRYVEVKLLSGVLPTCLEHGCISKLTLGSWLMLLTPKLKGLWKQRMKEDLIPAAERICCPYPSCLTVMSRTNFVPLQGHPSNVRACVKCSGLFCIDCKVPSHSGLSCADYKNLPPETLVNEMKLNSLAKENMWRQCVKCRLFIERVGGCIKIKCKCHYKFCYDCGVEWKIFQRECPSGCVESYYDDFDVEDEEEDDDDDEDEDDDGSDDGDVEVQEFGVYQTY